MSTTAANPPSDHLLRMLAAVPVSSQILDLGCGWGRHTEALLRLGFPVHACDPEPEAVAATRDRVGDLIGEDSAETSVQRTLLNSITYPDGTFNWVIADQAERYVSTQDELRTFMEESRRVLTPGGWLYLTVPAPASGETEEIGRFTSEMVDACRREVDLAEAREPTKIEEDGHRVRALYRRVAPDVST